MCDGPAQCNADLRKLFLQGCFVQIFARIFCGIFRKDFCSLFCREFFAHGVSEQMFRSDFRHGFSTDLGSVFLHVFFEASQPHFPRFLRFVVCIFHFFLFRGISSDPCFSGEGERDLPYFPRFSLYWVRIADFSNPTDWFYYEQPSVTRKRENCTARIPEKGLLGGVGLKREVESLANLTKPESLGTGE